jgi:hypothetical protein
VRHLGHRQFISYRFPFIIHYSFYHSKQYSLRYHEIHCKQIYKIYSCVRSTAMFSLLAPAQRGCPPWCFPTNILLHFWSSPYWEFRIIYYIYVCRIVDLPCYVIVDVWSVVMCRTGHGGGPVVCQSKCRVGSRFKILNWCTPPTLIDEMKTKKDKKKTNVWVSWPCCCVTS